MDGIHDLVVFVVAGLLLNLTPGPDLTYIAARSMAGGFRDGAAATFGITTGCVVHTIAAAAGLSALLATSAMAFEIVKWCGAAYLLYAGIRLMIGSAHARRADRPLQVIAPALPAKIFREAFIINVFNPKVALFFLAFLPQFIAADAPAKTLAFLLLGCLFNFNSLFVNLPVAWLASRAGRGLRGSARTARWLSGAVGALFVLLAARLATLEK
ncbi:MAG TPA: LysE family translocator [Casimicrobiaceae bacterium]|jgi:threonine/homoserine/homoserine lactone efflux protein